MSDQSYWRVRFDSIDEPILGEKWRRIFDEHCEPYRRWYLHHSDKSQPSYRQCRQALAFHMPELLRTYDHVCELAGGNDWVARFLSLYCPPRYITGCSQIVWPGDPYALIRNYDYHPKLLDGVILKSAWHGKTTIAMQVCLWGVTDGMNADGLAVSLTFGGGYELGEGFGVPIILRYILEFCRDVQDAAAVLARIPTHMTYNITLLDKTGAFLTAFIGPNQVPAIRPVPVATNHQGRNHRRSPHIDNQTVEREQLLNHCYAEGHMNEASILALFMQPPLYTNRYHNSFGTVFTSHYRPATGEIFYYWPHDTWDCSFDTFSETSRLVNFTPWGAFVEQGALPLLK